MSTEVGKIHYDLSLNTQAFEQAANNVSQKFNKIGDNLERVGRDLSLRVTAPIVGAGVAITKVSADFESSLSKIIGLVGVSQEQVNAWRSDILKLAQETAKAPAELADAMFFVTSAGIKGKEALDVLEMSAKAATAGLGETKIVADLVTSAMNAYGVENLSAAKATDILVATVREGKAEAPALAAAMGQVLPVASAMGITFDQVGAAVAGMTRTGTDAATASTQLRQIMVSILKPSSQARDTLESLGLSAGGLRSQIREEGLLSTLQTLVDAFGDNEEASALVFGNVRALAGVMDLLGGNAEENVKIFDSLKDSTGALDNAFGAASGTAGFKMQQALTTLKVIMIDLGDVLLPMVASGAQKLSKVLDKLGTIFKVIPDPVLKVIMVFAGLLAAIGPIRLIAGSVMKTIGSLSSVFAMFASHGIPIVISAIKLLGGALGFLAANPIVLLIVAIVGLVAVIVLNWDKIAAFTKKMVEDMKKSFEFWGNVIKAIGDFIAGVFELMVSNVKISIDLWRSIFESIGNFFKNYINQMINNFISGWTSIFDFTKRLWGQIKDAITSPFNTAVSYISNAINGAKNSVVNTFNSIKNFLWGLWWDIVEAISSPFREAKRKVDEIVGWIKDKMSWLNLAKRSSPSLVDKVRMSVAEIISEYEKLNNIRVPDLNYSFDTGLEAGNLGGARPVSQNINIHVDKMTKDLDVEEIGRELGFRAKLQ